MTNVPDNFRPEVILLQKVMQHILSTVFDKDEDPIKLYDYLDIDVPF